MRAVTVAFSHNPDDFVDWIWVVLSVALVLTIVAIVIGIFVRWAGARRRGRRPSLEARERR